MYRDSFTDFEQRLIHAGLAEPGNVLMGFLDDCLSWNHPSAHQDMAEHLFKGLSINSLMLIRPAEPYRSIIDYLAAQSHGPILPRDCETRTFLHDLPVASSLDPDLTIPMLKQRKSVVIPGEGVITYGTVSLEQAFVTFSSVCFSSFVKFFSDYLAAHKAGSLSSDDQNVFNRVLSFLPSQPSVDVSLAKGPFIDEEQVHLAMDEAGKLTVYHRLVDSFFGNISYCLEGVLYISQTGSSLDHLPGCIDPCPLDGSSCAALTASSELSAHMDIIKKTGHRAILHGHPKFSVIMSMDCDVKDCDGGDTCYLTCPHTRFVAGVPIVPGEVGTGPYGLCNTVPPAIINQDGVIVYGHGLFCTAKDDFNEAFHHLLSIENACRKEYFSRIQSHY